MDLVDRHVIASTAIPQDYAEHAAWQSMDAYLNDWKRAQRRLARQIVRLESMRDERRIATERGVWPPVDSGHAETPGSSDQNGSRRPGGER